MKVTHLLRKLEVRGQIEATQWINEDIKPIEAQRRTWKLRTFHNYCALCPFPALFALIKQYTNWAEEVLLNANISTYFTGSSLIALGLNWWQALISIVVGMLLATIFTLLNSMPGIYYHIGFPVSNRYVWGMHGSHFVIWNRIMLSLVWYGFQAWIGGQCFYIIMMAFDPRVEDHIPNHMPEDTGMTTAQFVAYIIFSVLSLPVVYIRPHRLEKFFFVAAATIIVFMITLLIWALATMGPGGFGDTLSSSSDTRSTITVGWLMIYGIISTIGSIAAGILNNTDYSRFSNRPRDAILGQAIGFPVYGIICSVIGIFVTAATQRRFNAALWNLPDIFTTLIEQHGDGGTRAAAFFAGLALVVSQIGVNVPGNALSGGCDLAATFPRYLNIRRGAFITAVASTAVNPWRLVNTATIFIAVLGSYSVFLGPMVGLMISGYYVVNKRKIRVPDLFVGDSSSLYWYCYGVNWRAFVAWFAGVAPSLPGFISAMNPNISVPEGFTNLYYMCFLIGFLISAIVYAALHRLFPVRRIADFVDDAATTPKTVMDMYREQWDDLGGAARGGEADEDMNQVELLFGKDTGSDSVGQDGSESHAKKNVVDV